MVFENSNDLKLNICTTAGKPGLQSNPCAVSLRALRKVNLHTGGASVDEEREDEVNVIMHKDERLLKKVLG